MNSTIHLSSPNWLSSNHPPLAWGSSCQVLVSTNHFFSLVQICRHTWPLYFFIYVYPPTIVPRVKTNSKNTPRIRCWLLYFWPGNERFGWLLYCKTCRGGGIYGESKVVGIMLKYQPLLGQVYVVPRRRTMLGTLSVEKVKESMLGLTRT